MRMKYVPHLLKQMKDQEIPLARDDFFFLIHGFARYTFGSRKAGPERSPSRKRSIHELDIAFQYLDEMRLQGHPAMLTHLKLLRLRTIEMERPDLLKRLESE